MHHVLVMKDPPDGELVKNKNLSLLFIIVIYLGPKLLYSVKILDMFSEF